ncbi:DUF5677 domain-containing protein [Stenotrophomonas sp. PS02289]|uniref:DUF5677 domain-containing protein n=1 Tax=Stenotrophomonas sp. PS02289 TaxID=2991422 RepID=UPI00249AC83C|nr:DUF5677 domain-containing protein [Stenotrophomonas sp. PS02289]
MTPLIQSALSISNGLLTEVNALIGSMRAPTNAPGRPQTALFMTIAEQFESVVRLALAGLITHSAVHVRSMSEAVADLHLLGTDQDHVDRMRYNQAVGEKRFYDHLLESDGLPESVRQLIEERMPGCLERYTPLHAKFKSAKQSQAQAFIAADMEYMLPFYTMLCGFSHNDLSALGLRHQGERAMTHRAETPDEVAFVILQLAVTALMQATSNIGGIAKFRDGEFDRRFTAMNDLFGKLLDSRPIKTDDLLEQKRCP